LITKSRVVGLLLVLGSVLLVFRPGDEPSNSIERGGDSESSTDRQFQPREPAFLESRRDYGIAGNPGVREAPSPYGVQRPNARGTYPQRDSDGSGTPGTYGGQAPIQTNGYRFRPLDEQEKERMQASHPERYQAPYYSAPAEQQQSIPRPTYSAQSMAPGPQRETYSFRPLEKSRASRGRWQGPYQDPGWRGSRPPLDPWTAPPDPQWGSTPPAQRMYPSYLRDTSRRITAR
jgi:hypothetical protein